MGGGGVDMIRAYLLNTSSVKHTQVPANPTVLVPIIKLEEAGLKIIPLIKKEIALS